MNKRERELESVLNEVILHGNLPPTKKLSSDTVRYYKQKMLGAALVALYALKAGDARSAFRSAAKAVVLERMLVQAGEQPPPLARAALVSVSKASRGMDVPLEVKLHPEIKRRMELLFLRAPEDSGTRGE